MGEWGVEGYRGTKEVSFDCSRNIKLPLGTDHNVHLAYAPGLELNHMIMSKLEENGGQ